MIAAVPGTPLAAWLVGAAPGRALAGPAVVLLHGFPLDHRMWLPVAERLGDAGHRVLLIDLPGLGSSAVPGSHSGQVPSLVLAAELVVTTVATAGLDRVYAAGMSMGGYVVLEWLRGMQRGVFSADQLAGVALVDTKDTPDGPDAKQSRLDMADAVLRDGSPAAAVGGPRAQLSPTTIAERPELLARAEMWVMQQRPAAIAWSQRAMAGRPAYDGVLSAYEGPVAVIVGTDDAITPVAGAHQMAARAHDARVFEIAEAGHLAAYEQPEVVAQALITAMTPRRDA